ncbi:hypothetical protein V6N13_019740 [Hibiscus sabdariffa]
MVPSGSSSSGSAPHEHEPGAPEPEQPLLSDEIRLQELGDRLRINCLGKAMSLGEQEDFVETQLLIEKKDRPSSLFRRSYAKLLIGSQLFLTAMAIYLSLRVAPLDLQQGGNSRIPYVHVPAARMVTWVFWGRPMWGTFWVWDARLTSVFVSVLIYLGALRFQKLPVEPAFISICVGPIDIPIIKSLVNWWNTSHQPGSISRSEVGKGSRSPFKAPPLGRPKLYQLFWTWVTPWARRLRRLNWSFPIWLSKWPTYLTLDGDESPHSIAFPVSYDSSRDSAEEGSFQPTFYPIGPYTFLVNLASSRLRPSVPIPRPYYLGGPCFLLLMELLL